MRGFGEGELSTCLGAGRVTPTSARIWGRTEHPGTAELVIEAEGGKPLPPVSVLVEAGDADNTAAWTYPDDFPGARPLEPNTRYRARLSRGGAELGTARFSTPPDSRGAAPSSWTFGVFSCHQPFSEDGSVHPEGLAMMSAARRALSDVDARFVLMMGDQIYADYPKTLSLFERSYFERLAPKGCASVLECDRAQVRRIYQQRHRQFWALEQFQSLQSSFACYPILDDHEVVDNFGTDPQHVEPAWEGLLSGALDAFYDYQTARVLDRRPDSFDYGFVWGPAAIYVMDIRSQRRTKDGKTEVFSRSQFLALRDFMNRHADAGLFVLVTTIPLVYVEGKVVKALAALLSQGSDVHERWSHPSCVAARDMIVRLLHDHALENPQQMILLLGGDVHTGAAYSVQFDDGPRLYQLVSSAISNREQTLHGKASEVASRTVNGVDAERCLDASVHLLSGVEEETSRNPFGGLNLGLVDVMDRGDRIGLNLRLISYQEDGSPNTIFESGELPRRSD